MDLLGQRARTAPRVNRDLEVQLVILVLKVLPASAAPPGRKVLKGTRDLRVTPDRQGLPDLQELVGAEGHPVSLAALCGTTA
jgi:hypothetical protein